MKLCFTPEQCVLDISKFHQSTQISKSENGEIRTVYNKEGTNKFRQKIINLKISDKKQEKFFIKSINTLMSMGHPAINKIHGCIISDNQTSIISNYEINGSLEDVIMKVKSGESPKTWNSTKKMITIFGIASSLMYVHGCRMLHRNLKAKNILFDEKFEPKLTDFNFSKQEVDITDNLTFEEHSYNEIPFFEAPEQLGFLPCSNKVDVYSFAVLMYIILMGDYPKFEINDPDAIVASVIVGTRPDLPSHIIPKAYRELITECWANDSSDRPSFKLIVRKLVSKEYILKGTDINVFENYVKKVIHNEFLLRNSFKSKSNVCNDSDDNSPINKIKQKADDGDPQSQLQYAEMLSTGKEIPLNMKKAMEYYEKAAVQGNETASLKVALKAEIEQKWEIAEKYFRIAAEKGNNEARFHLGSLLKNGTGNGLNQDYFEAAHFFKLAADQGEADAQNKYAEMLMKGQGVIMDQKLAAEYYKRAADQGDKEAQYQYAKILYDGKVLACDKISAIKYLLKSADQNECSAMISLAEIYMDDKDYKKAAYFFNLSGKLGFKEGGEKFKALLKEKGVGNEQDIEEVNKFFQQNKLLMSRDDMLDSFFNTSNSNFYSNIDSDNEMEIYKHKADKGDAKSQLIYGKMLRFGTNQAAEANPKMAVTYLQMAADQGESEAMQILGEMLRDGIGTDKDLKKAQKWLLRASDAGNSQAMADYGYLRMKGYGFNHPNFEKAKIYFEKSAALGNGDGQAYLAMIIRDKEPEKANELIEKSAKQNNQIGEYLLALINKEKGLEFKSLLQSSAAKGYLEALYELALLNNDLNMIKNAADQGVNGACFKYATLIRESSISEALWYFTKAAESGDPAAEVEAAICLSKSNPQKRESYLRSAMYKKYPRSFTEMGVLYEEKENFKDAAHMYHIASVLHDTKGMLKYGIMYKEGLGVNRNYGKAHKYLKMSADNGDSEGQLQFGLFTADDDESIQYLKMSANNGNNEACYYLGMTLKKEENYIEALKWFKIAAKNGHEDSMFQVAVFYQNGYASCGSNLDEGKAKNLKKAAKYYKKSASLPNSKAASQFNWGLMLKNGWGTEQNSLLAAKFFRLSALQGDTDAMNNYGLMLRNGEGGVKQNLNEAIKFFKMAADNGNDLAQNNYAVLVKSGASGLSDYPAAFKYFKMAADKGNQSAMNNYALMLKNGEGTPNGKKNYKEAAKIFKIAADKGNNKSAMHNYSMMLFDGLGIDKNFTEAAKYAKKAADLGELNAMNNYGVALKLGKGIQKNIPLAVKYFKTAADSGNSNAMSNYATMVREGNGVKKDINESLKYYQMAIDKGNANAMNCMALLYLTGNGVKKDKSKAMELYKLSMDIGNKNGMKNYLRLQTKRSNSLPF